MKRHSLFLFWGILFTACNSGIALEGTDLSLFLWSGLRWTWIESGKEENAISELVYQEKFGEGNSLRLNQSMCIYRDRVFCFNHGKECCVYDLDSKERLSSDPLPDKSHHNNAQFSHFFYSESDDYPLLFLSRGDYPPNQNDLYVVRVEETDKVISFSVVKTIHNTIQEAQYNGSWVVDDVHGKLYLYTMAAGDWRVKEDNVFCVFSFPLPDMNDSEDVTLGYEDVLTKWEYSYLVLQGGTYYNDYLLFNVQHIQTIGGVQVSSPQSVIAVNPKTGRIDTFLPLDEQKETEGICVYNDKMYVSFKRGSQDQNPNDVVFTLKSYTLPATISYGI